MIKRIDDKLLSEVKGGKQGAAMCICSIVCSCDQQKQSARTLNKGPYSEFRNTKKFS